MERRIALYGEEIKNIDKRKDLIKIDAVEWNKLQEKLQHYEKETTN